MLLSLFRLSRWLSRLMKLTTKTLLSIVVPALDEAAAIPLVLTDLRGLRVSHEIIVVDGGSRDTTVLVAAECGARVLLAASGRGFQLSAGANAATAGLLWFLHADVRVGADVLRAVERIAESGERGAFAFKLAIDSPENSYRILERLANVRSRWLSLPYGDQSLLVTRADYDAAGGYPAIPIMEDVALVRALGRTTEITILNPAIRVSPRRWRRDGVLHRTARNSLLLAAYVLGASPQWIAARYKPQSANNSPDTNAS